MHTYFENTQHTFPFQIQEAQKVKSNKPQRKITMCLSKLKNLIFQHKHKQKLVSLQLTNDKSAILKS